MRRFTCAAAQRRWLLLGLPRVAREWFGAPQPSLVGFTPAMTATARLLHTTSLSLAPKEAPYQCGECGKTFRLLNALNHHILTRHGNKAKALMKKDGALVEMTAEQLKGSSHSGAAASPIPGLSAAPSSPLGAAAAVGGGGGAAAAAPAGSGFPGVFGAPFGSPPTSSSSPAVSAAFIGAVPGVSPTPAAGAPGSNADAATDAATDTATADEDAEKRSFVCTICQKTFRLEAALQHHYQAKHNMDMPSMIGGSGSGNGTAASSSSSATAGGLAGFGSGAATTAANSFGAAAMGSAAGGEASSSSSASLGGMSAAQYIRQQEGTLPDAPQYHLDVAPNAPEEGDIAAHWRCVNLCVLMGSVREVEDGYVFQDHVLQFTVATEFANPSPGDPDMDFHTVRVYGDEFWQPLKADIQAGGRFLVTGRLRMVPQYDTVMKKYYHYPVIQVFPGTGNVVRA
ncbi:putative mitochondrial RNA-editing complex protein [Leptomonas pyrrhocoris]|uniref:Putative mitochondrial RNA-editing complex protein n=1 Tax=Leptomonas pyrrhocoris TaxID=157538 RepID=A0A0M9FR00_LEPPY|nr:putative mitochondrial RNA-editing complex protein [Leptomonas pyrrhocoris]KPA74237.1 putative mitochondrial RNA-editing complex protein [Leptomonas pyrrhocoris]|eukprot:XP_015652676.1 putative mitochondrial RNA-editing complex protein [Leptomonas pyrrhocoris]